MGRQVITDEISAYIKKFYATQGAKSVCDKFGIGESAVWAHAHKLGVARQRVQHKFDDEQINFIDEKQKLKLTQDQIRIALNEKFSTDEKPLALTKSQYDKARNSAIYAGLIKTTRKRVRSEKAKLEAARLKVASGDDFHKRRISSHGVEAARVCMAPGCSGGTIGLYCEDHIDLLRAKAPAVSLGRPRGRY